MQISCHCLLVFVANEYSFVKKIEFCRQSFNSVVTKVFVTKACIYGEKKNFSCQNFIKLHFPVVYIYIYYHIFFPEIKKKKMQCQGSVTFICLFSSFFKNFIGERLYLTHVWDIRLKITIYVGLILINMSLEHALDPPLQK